MNASDPMSPTLASFARTSLPGQILYGNDSLDMLTNELDAQNLHRTILSSPAAKPSWQTSAG